MPNNILGALATGATSALGGLPGAIIGAGSTLLTNWINQKFSNAQSQFNFDLAEKSAENQYNRQLDFWNKQNFYNTPLEQVRRRLDAGLSPVESVDSGNASSLSSVPGNNVGLNGARNFTPNVNIDLLQSMQSLQNLTNLGKQGDLMDVQIGNLFKDMYLKELEGQLRRAGLKEAAERLKGIIKDNAIKDKQIEGAEYDNKVKKFQSEDNWLLQTLNKLMYEASMARSGADIAAYDADFYSRMGLPASQVTARDRVLLELGTKLLSNLIPNFKGLKDLTGLLDIKNWKFK